MKRTLVLMSMLLFASIFSCKKENESDPNSFTDPRDGQVYKFVQIGSQIWMAENLNYGVIINSSEQPGDNGIVEKYAYGDNSGNCPENGGLYTWNEAMQYVTTPGAQGVCPDGWHIPTDEEWKELEIFLGMDIEDVEIQPGYRGTDEGFQLKEGGTRGMNVKLSGFWNELNNEFSHMEITGLFYTSDDLDTPFGFTRQFKQDEGGIYRGGTPKNNALSIRCIKD